MKILLSIPPAPFVLTEIEPGLESLQQAVGGSVEFVYIGRGDAELIINEESLIKGLLPNREANRLFRRVIGYGNLLCGPVLVVGTRGEHTVSVPQLVADAVAKGTWPPAGRRKAKPLRG